MSISLKNKYCEICDYNTSRKSSYDKHLLTPKHQKQAMLTSCEYLLTEEKEQFICTICNKEYKSRVGLWYHSKKCQSKTNNTENDLIQVLIKENSDFKNMILDVVKNNTELQKQMLDLCKNGNTGNKNNNNVINSNNNNHNKTFNLQVFLNEECKDAMNLTDFMNSFQLQLEDLEKVGTMGYVDGVSNIILKKLRDMDVNKRPMHCSDAKREIMYIKEEDKWEKEGLNNLKLKKAITIIENKNIKLLGAWKEAHPKYMEYDEPDNDTYTHLIIQTMSNCDDFGNKVIKKLAKEVTIDK
jgi:hypothetical protein